MDAVFAVLADPTRLRILAALQPGERSVGDLVERVGMHQPGVSRHLRVLLDAGLVQVRQDAQRRLYSLDPAPLKALDVWLQPYRKLWDARLDNLADHLAKNKRSDLP